MMRFPESNSPASLASTLAATALALLLSGCFGYPEGTARMGDSVTVEYTAYDPLTHEVLARNQTAFGALGLGETGLGADVERALVGMKANETRMVESPAASRQYAETRATPAVYQKLPRTDHANRTTFEKKVGPARLGMAFGAGFFNATISAIEGGDVTFVRSPRAAQEYPELGIRVTTRIEGDDAMVVLEPLVGTTFSTTAGVDTLGLPPGSYKTLGSNATHIRFAYSPLAAPGLVDHAVTLQITLVSVAPTQGTVTGPLGARP